MKTPISQTIILLGLLAASLLPVHARASITLADFQESLDLPDYSLSGPRVLQNLARALGAGFELAENNQIANPSDWGESLQVDFDGATLTLQPTDSSTYQTITLTISNVAFSVPGEQIRGCKSFSVSCSAFAKRSSPAGAAERRRA